MNERQRIQETKMLMKNWQKHLKESKEASAGGLAGHNRAEIAKLLKQMSGPEREEQDLDALANELDATADSLGDFDDNEIEVDDDQIISSEPDETEVDDSQIVDDSPLSSTDSPQSTEPTKPTQSPTDEKEQQDKEKELAVTRNQILQQGKDLSLGQVNQVLNQIRNVGGTSFEDIGNDTLKQVNDAIKATVKRLSVRPGSKELENIENVKDVGKRIMTRLKSSFEGLFDARTLVDLQEVLKVIKETETSILKENSNTNNLSFFKVITPFHHSSQMMVISIKDGFDVTKKVFDTTDHKPTPDILSNLEDLLHNSFHSGAGSHFFKNKVLPGWEPEVEAHIDNGKLFFDIKITDVQVVSDSYDILTRLEQIEKSDLKNFINQINALIEREISDLFKNVSFINENKINKKKIVISIKR